MSLVSSFRRWLSQHRNGGAPASLEGVGSPAPELQPEGGVWRAEGAAHLAAGRLAEAERAVAQALECGHDDVEALMLQASVYRKQGRLEEAADSLVLATHFAPDLAEARYRLGLVAADQQQHAEAERCFRRAIERDPGHGLAYHMLGAQLADRGDVEEAVEMFEKAVGVNPALAVTHSNLGCLLITRCDRFDEGAAHIETAWRLAPDDPSVMCNWAMLLQYRGELPQALELFDRLIAADRNADIARLNRALALLKQGDFARGWPDYEARKRVARELRQRGAAHPEWRGEPLEGRTVLVEAEQGLGDQIMFASCVPDLIELGGRVTIECNAKLAEIFRRSFPAAAAVISRGTEGVPTVKQLDFGIAMGSLSLHFRRSPDAFPRHSGYLRADPERTVRWQRRLAELPGAVKIGISWRGGTDASRRSVRSMALEDWLPLLQRPDASIVSLQYTDCQEETDRIARDHGVRVHHWQDAIDDYEETAALVCALDLVISVQTAVVHLAGALGRPVWVLVPAVAEWRYGTSGETMPWYPSARLFRQGSDRRWEPVVEKIAGALNDLCGRSVAGHDMSR